MAALAYFVFVELARLSIELEVTEGQKTHRTFHVARCHHLSPIVHTRRERNVDKSLFKPGHHALSNVTVPAQDDAFENRFDLAPDYCALCRDARLVDMTISRGRNPTVNKLDTHDVVGDCRNAKCLDRSLANHASRARASCRNRRVSNQLVRTILTRRKRSHVLMKHRVDLHIFVTHVAENLACHLAQHTNCCNVLRAMALLGITDTDAPYALPHGEQCFEYVRDYRNARWDQRCG